jgi:hypothetical protein
MKSGENDPSILLRPPLARQTGSSVLEGSGSGRLFAADCRIAAERLVCSSRLDRGSFEPERQKNPFIN